MTKKRMATIVSLYKDGVSSEVCIAIIIELCNKKDCSNLVKGTYIHSFYEEIFKLEEKK